MIANESQTTMHRASQVVEKVSMLRGDQIGAAAALLVETEPEYAAKLHRLLGAYLHPRSAEGKAEIDSVH